MIEAFPDLRDGVERGLKDFTAVIAQAQVVVHFFRIQMDSWLSQ
jgi:hypothetical protein